MTYMYIAKFSFCEIMLNLFRIYCRRPLTVLSLLYLLIQILAIWKVTKLAGVNLSNEQNYYLELLN